MANSINGNVWVVDTDGACPFTVPTRVKSIQLVSDGTNAATLSLKAGGASGVIVWQGTVAATTTAPSSYLDINLKAADLYADIGGTGAKAYIVLA